MNGRDIAEIIECLEIQESKFGSYVCRYGEHGDEFYITIKGRASVFIPVTNEKVFDVVSQFKKTIGQIDSNNTDFQWQDSKNGYM